MPIDLYFMELSPPCNTVILLAKTLGIDLNLIHLDVENKKEHLTEAFLKLNPEHTIPTIVDHGFAVWESRAILIYLVQKYATDDSLYPSDPAQRARVNQRLFFDLGTLFQRLVDHYYTQVLDKRPPVPGNYERINDALAFLDHYLSAQKYVAGDTLTVADFTAAITVLSLEAIRHEYAKYTNVVRWYEHLKATLPGWADVAKNMEEFAPYFVNVVREGSA